MTTTVDEQIRDRLYQELKDRQEILSDQKVIDGVLENTTVRMNEYIHLIATTLKEQEAAMGQMAEIRERQKDLTHHTKETANLGINLADVFFRSDVNLFIKHLTLADDDIIVLALTHDPELLSRLRQLIRQIDERIKSK